MVGEWKAKVKCNLWLGVIPQSRGRSPGSAAILAATDAGCKPTLLKTALQTEALRLCVTSGLTSGLSGDTFLAAVRPPSGCVA
jgi:hypothetical protein